MEQGGRLQAGAPFIKTATMYSLPKRFIAIMLLSTLLLQSCSEDRHAGTLRMAGSEGQEATDKKPSTESRGGHGALSVPAASLPMPLIFVPDQGQVPLVAAIAPPDSTASTSPASLSGTSLGAFVPSSSFPAAPPSTAERYNKELDAAVDDRKPSALLQSPALSTVSVMALSPASGVMPVSAQPQGASLTSEELKNQEQACAQKLQSLVSDTLLEETSDVRKKMATVLKQLAALHKEQGYTTGKLSHYTDAAVCHQHALHMWEKKAPGYEAQMKEAYQGLAQIRAAMIASIKKPKGRLHLSMHSRQRHFAQQ
jgi:hypothetical protein